MSEHALENVARTAGLRTIIVRLGQVAGDESAGYWSEREWFPALVKTAIYHRCLPDLEGVCIPSSPPFLRTALTSCLGCAVGTCTGGHEASDDDVPLLGSVPFSCLPVPPRLWGV